MKKKIGLMLDTEPKFGGEHQYAILVVESLLQSKKFDLVLLCGNKFWRKWCREKKIRNLNYPFPYLSEKEKMFNYKFSFVAKWINMYMTPMGKAIREESIDIVFSVRQGVFVPNVNAKIILPVHDLMHRYEGRFSEVSESYDSRELCMRSMAKYAACILVDSKLGKLQFEESYLKRSYKKPVICRLPYVAPKHIRETKEEEIETPEKFVFYPAQFWKHKNHINLIKAIKILKNTIPDIHLVLVGSEKNNGTEIKKYLKDNELENNVTMLGFVSDGKITYLYKHAVGMIMPSYFGPTNIPPLEGMALGCPVAVSNKYAMPEQVGKAGLLFNPDSPEEIAECIRKIWVDDKLRKKMIKLGYQKIQKWTEYEFGERLNKIMASI